MAAEILAPESLELALPRTERTSEVHGEEAPGSEDAQYDWFDEADQLEHELAGCREWDNMRAGGTQ